VERDHGFNRARYERLLRDIGRYQRYLQHTPAEAGAAQGPGWKDVKPQAEES
jgi:hypothetical protein